MAIKLELDIKEAELVVAGLYKLPMEIAEPIVNKIKSQAIPQVQAKQQAEADKAAETSAPVETAPENAN